MFNNWNRDPKSVKRRQDHAKEVCKELAGLKEIAKKKTSPIGEEAVESFFDMLIGYFSRFNDWFFENNDWYFKKPVENAQEFYLSFFENLEYDMPRIRNKAYFELNAHEQDYENAGMLVNAAKNLALEQELSAIKKCKKSLKGEGADFDGVIGSFLEATSQNMELVSALVTELNSELLESAHWNPEQYLEEVKK
ncbi:MAG: hypothetical protein ACP5T3_02115, partial [Candidatus Micrarchaeia archaeon]